MNEQRLRFSQTDPKQPSNRPRWRITAAHILVDSEAFARQCIAWLDETVPENQHACFENLAAMYSQCGSAMTHGVIGVIEPGQTDPDFESALCKLRPGEWSKEPVKTSWGWHVVARIE
jgi:parvulin-like peptidyl-prolyl isomerase